MDSVQYLLCLFMAMDETNNLCWCSFYLEDMRCLPETAPELHQSFLEGKFVVKHTHGKFKAVEMDMALEQTINLSHNSSSRI